MSGLNLTEIVQYASIFNCSSYETEVAQGTINFSASCINNNATDASQFLCPTAEEIIIPFESDCESLVSAFIQLDPLDYVCAIACLERAPDAGAATKLAARGLPEFDGSAVAGAATTLHPTNFLVSFAALLFVMLVFFKRM